MRPHKCFTRTTRAHVASAAELRKSAAHIVRMARLDGGGKMHTELFHLRAPIVAPIRAHIGTQTR